jgi:ABC-type antimicrobial peptide transport system permease subunit
MALGADASRVVRMVLLESGMLVAVGLTVGVALAFAAARAASALLYGLQPLDPPSFLAGIGGLAAVGVLASWLPARRASRLSPTVALRE